MCCVHPATDIWDIYRRRWCLLLQMTYNYIYKAYKEWVFYYLTQGWIYEGGANHISEAWGAIPWKLLGI